MNSCRRLPVTALEAAGDRLREAGMGVADRISAMQVGRIEVDVGVTVEFQRPVQEGLYLLVFLIS